MSKDISTGNFVIAMITIGLLFGVMMGVIIGVNIVPKNIDADNNHIVDNSIVYSNDDIMLNVNGTEYIVKLEQGATIEKMEEYIRKYQKSIKFIELIGKITNERIKFEGIWKREDINNYQGFAFFLPFEGFLETAKITKTSIIYTDFTIESDVYYFWFYVDGSLWTQFNDDDVLVYTSNQFLEAPKEVLLK